MKPMQVTVRCNRPVGHLPHFWQGTGFAQPKLLLRDDMRQALQYITSLPHGGITYVRPHYLFRLVSISGRGSSGFVYDWSQLDQALDFLVENDLKLFLELMGNPSNYFSDFEDARQVNEWREFVRDFAQRYIERYGIETVKSWYFECWNEPDIPSFWPYGMQSLFNYFDGCEAGLHEASSSLRLGGPGTALFLSDTFKAFLEHCHNGENYFTGQTGTRLDFISFHEKAAWASEVDLNPNTRALIEREKAIIRFVREHYPHFAHLPLMNNECDPQVGFGHAHTWRARPYYAAIVCKVINQHLIEIMDGQQAKFTFLSNDNGFMGGWGQRTLLARFTQEPLAAGDQDSSLTHFELIKKPVLNVMALLSLLGDTRCEVQGTGDAFAPVGLLATSRGTEQIAVLVYHSTDAIVAAGCETINLHMESIPFEEAMLVHYRMDAAHGNPFDVWAAMQDPVYHWHQGPQLPTAAQFAALREQQELAMLHEPRPVCIEQGSLQLQIEMPLPSVSLILLFGKPPSPPESIRKLRAQRYGGLHETNSVLLMWQGLASRTLRTYEVLYSRDADGPYRRVNAPDLICTGFLHLDAGNGGYYRVCARDYWGRRGPESDVLAVEARQMNEESRL